MTGFGLSEETVPTLARLLAMTDARRIDTALVLRALDGDGLYLRAAAALAIGQVRARALAPRLREAVITSDTAVAANAAYSIGLLRDSSAVPALAAALYSDPVIASEAAWALGEIATPEAAAVIESRLRRRDVAGPVLHSLLLAAAKLRPPPTEVLASYLGSADTALAWRAAYALGRNRPPGGVRPLLSQVLSANMQVREHVARGLARVAAGDSLADEALDALNVLAVAPHPHVRVNAIQSLATYGERARLPILAATRDGDPHVRVAAARALADVMNRDLIRWVWLWDQDTTHAYRRAVLEGAMQVGVLLPALGSWSTSPDWRERAAVVGAAGAAAPDVALQWARSAASDADPRVRLAAMATLARWIDSAPDVENLLRRALRDTSSMVKAAALDGVARRATAADLPLAIEILGRGLPGRAVDVRQSAARLVAAAWRRDSASVGDTLRRALAALPPPPEPLVRAAARGVSPLAHWPAAEPEPKPIRFYEELARTVILAVVRGTLPVVEVRTERGTLVLELWETDAPLTVYNFLMLTRGGFYARTNFHRVVPNFVVQDGDPRGDGRSGLGYTIRDELNRRRYERGTVGMALSGPDTGGSQYFITHSPQPHLDGGYTAFGRVRAGFDVLDVILQGDRILEVVVR